MPSGSDGLLFLPHLQGQRSPDYNPAASGVFFGVDINHTRGHFFRAVLESFAYELRRGLDTFYPNGLEINRVVATGGGARSPLWLQIVSDIMGFRQEYIPDADGSLGDAYVAGINLGWYEDFHTLKSEWIEVESITEANPENKRVYDRLFSLYCDLHKAVDEPYRRHNLLTRRQPGSGPDRGQ